MYHKANIWLIDAHAKGYGCAYNVNVLHKEGILIVPLDAVYKNGESYCLVKQSNAKEPARARVELGIADDKNVEVISGVNEKDRLIAKSKKYSLPKSSSSSNPFMPFGKKKEPAKK